jgi:hypothetical protein
VRQAGSAGSDPESIDVPAPRQFPDRVFVGAWL